MISVVKTYNTLKSYLLPKIVSGLNSSNLKQTNRTSKKYHSDLVVKASDCGGKISRV